MSERSALSTCFVKSFLRKSDSSKKLFIKADISFFLQWRTVASATEATLTIPFLGNEFTVIGNHQSDCYIININLLRAEFNLIIWILNAWFKWKTFFFEKPYFELISIQKCVVGKMNSSNLEKLTWIEFLPRNAEINE